MPVSRASARFARSGLAACASLAATTLGATDAGAVERQWHVGLDGGYALAAFPATKLGGVDLAAAKVSGFDVGLHGTYGLTDAFNLRAHADLSAFDLPEPRSSVISINSGLGAEYVFDVLRWVPYVGVTAGPNVLLVQGDRSVVQLAIEVPGGLGYQLNRSWTIGAEVRYRLLLLGEPDRTPTHGFVGLARAEFAWGS